MAPSLLLPEVLFHLSGPAYASRPVQMSGGICENSLKEEAETAKLLVPATSNIPPVPLSIFHALPSLLEALGKERNNILIWWPSLTDFYTARMAKDCDCFHLRFWGVSLLQTKLCTAWAAQPRSESYVYVDEIRTDSNHQGFSTLIFLNNWMDRISSIKWELLSQYLTHWSGENLRWHQLLLAWAPASLLSSMS